MIFLRNNDNDSISIIQNSKTILELKFESDEFCCKINTDDKIIISKELDQSFYDNLSLFMQNRYVFNNSICKKTPNLLIWLSDQHGDIDDVNETNIMNRLVIEKENDRFLLSYQNPFFQKLGIKKSSHMIILSPGGNGYWSKNIETGLTLQTEFVKMFRKVLNNEKITEKRKDLK